MLSPPPTNHSSHSPSFHFFHIREQSQKHTEPSFSTSTVLYCSDLSRSAHLTLPLATPSSWGPFLCSSSSPAGYGSWTTGPLHCGPQGYLVNLSHRLLLWILTIWLLKLKASALPRSLLPTLPLLLCTAQSQSACGACGDSSPAWITIHQDTVPLAGKERGRQVILGLERPALPCHDLAALPSVRRLEEV